MIAETTTTEPCDRTPGSFPSSLRTWAEGMVVGRVPGRGISIGMISGHRDACDLRAVYMVAKELSLAINSIPGNQGLLLIRLSMYSKLPGMKSGVEESVEPLVQKSALGAWHQTEISIQLGSTASPALQQLPRWVVNWKLGYSLILLDLGPIHLVPSRMLGRLCDQNFLLLGPNFCASAQWLMQFIDYHAYCGSHIAGTLVSSLAA
ncbi:MAG: hypothetical protein KF752_12540 [Pirellulaceae bacterium]|nr:hypothetical protein [Pirellulaceae bacterium]